MANDIPSVPIPAQSLDLADEDAANNINPFTGFELWPVAAIPAAESRAASWSDHDADARVVRIGARMDRPDLILSAKRWKKNGLGTADEWWAFITKLRGTPSGS